MAEEPAQSGQPQSKEKVSPLEKLLTKGRSLPERNRRLLILVVFGLSFLLMAKWGASHREVTDPYAAHPKVKFLQRCAPAKPSRLRTVWHSFFQRVEQKLASLLPSCLQPPTVTVIQCGASRRSWRI
jgi:hypothetical protein